MKRIETLSHFFTINPAPMKKLLLTIAVFFTIIIFSNQVNAQCAMCQATAESSRDAGSANSDGINKGVLYLFLTPYLLIGTVGYFWWKARKKEPKTE